MSALFSPFTLKSLTLRNRIARLMPDGTLERTPLDSARNDPRSQDHH